MKKTLLLLLFTGFAYALSAQDYNVLTEDGRFTPAQQRQNKGSDSIQSQHKEVPKGLKVWTVDELFGDRTPAIPDTVSHMYMNSIFTTGLRGEYNTLGNLGTPRLNRIFIERPELENEFIFIHPFSYFITPVSDFHFTNTYSPITNLSFNTCGNRTNGEDHFKALFAINAGKKFGAGFKFDYLYGRGYYQNQSTSLFNYSMFASYIGDQYQAHLLLSANHMKQAENGGITDDNYITHPESFNDSYTENEIPTVLERNWNRNDNQQIFFTHRYNIGFRRKVHMTEDEINARKFAIESKKENQAEKDKQDAIRKAREEGRSFNENEYDKQKAVEGRPENAIIAGNEPKDSIRTQGERITVSNAQQADSLMAIEKKAAEDSLWYKTEYVPVTSFIHTLKFDNYKRLYTAHDVPDGYYANTFYDLANDSINDKTRFYELNNTFAVALLEGFNKWAKAGLKAYVTHNLRHYTLPDSIGGTNSYTDHSVYAGGQISKREGKTLHYNLAAEFGVAGVDAGDMFLDANADLNVPLFGDTVTLEANAFLHRTTPAFYYSHYHSKHFWWDNNELERFTHSRISATLSSQKTRTAIKVAFDNIKNYTYFGHAYNITEDYGRTANEVNVRQCPDGISLFTAQLSQDLTFGPLNWETVLTYQKSSKQDILTVPALNVYTNLYLKFKIAKVLKCDFGADMRLFTKYYAPDYAPGLGQFTIQENEASRVKLGGYPIVNVYANFHLKHTRFFIMMSHVNAGSGSREYFLTPHYPLNGRILRLGLSWNFFN
ncbi:MAG: putative porin [Prevotella sp.]|nr:putative porin [Prevotella sp.]